MSVIAEHLDRGQPVKVAELDKSGNLVRTWNHAPDNHVRFEYLACCCVANI